MHSPLFRTALVCLAFSLPTAVIGQDRDRQSERREISEDRALRIARGYGMVDVREIERDDGGWEIEGRDRRGRELEIDINRDGRVTRVDRSEDSDDDDVVPSTPSLDRRPHQASRASCHLRKPICLFRKV